MTTRQKVIVFVSIIITLGLSIMISMAIAQSKEAKKPPTPPISIRKVQTEIVEYTDILTTVSGTGRVLSQHSIDIIAEVQGKLIEGDIPLKKGSNFTKGQLIARIYNSEASYSMKSTKSSFLNTLASILPDVKIDYPDSYQKWFSFFEEIDIAKELPMLPEISSNQEKIFLASKGILSNYYTIKSSEERLRKYNLWAPYSGSIQDVMLEVGSVANTGSRVASIIKTGSLEIEVPLQVDDAKWVKKGQIAMLQSESGMAIGKGKVVRKATYIDPASQSINIYIELLPGSKDVYAGQYLKANFSGMLIKSVMEIPRNAYFNGNEVFVIEEGYLQKKEIEIKKANENTILFSGLEVGTEIVSQPLANATSSMAVQSEFSNVHKTTEKDTTPENKETVKE